MLSEQETQLLLPFDLSRLALFEHQKFRQWVAVWRLHVERKRKSMYVCVCVWLLSVSFASDKWFFYNYTSSFQVNMGLTHLADTVPIYALRANLDQDPQFQQLKVVCVSLLMIARLILCLTCLHVVNLMQSLRLEESPEVELRDSAPTGRKGGRPRWTNNEKWVGAVDEQDPATTDNNSVSDAKETSSEELCGDSEAPKSDSLFEIVRFRSSVTNVGCGPIAVRCSCSLCIWLARVSASH